MELFAISNANAYRKKKDVETYLKNIGLRLESNQVVGEEYRLRYLLALLQFQYGYNCVEITPEDIKLARSFIKSTNDAITEDFLSYTVDEYGYYETLLILAWKRRAYTPFTKVPAELKNIRDIFIYEAQIPYIQEHLEKPLGLTFSDKDYLYLFLIYCSTNSCVLADKWTQEKIDMVHSTIYNVPRVKDLMEQLEAKFGTCITSSRIMRVTLIYFFKLSLLELHCIIPGKWETKTELSTPFAEYIAEETTKILAHWKKDHGIKYHFSDYHVQYIASQLENTLREQIGPIKVVVLSDLILDIEIVRIHVSQIYSQDKVTVQGFVLCSENLQNLSHLENAILVLGNKYQNILSHITLPPSSQLVMTTDKFNQEDRFLLNTKIVSMENKLLGDYLGLN